MISLIVQSAIFFDSYVGRDSDYSNRVVILDRFDRRSLTYSLMIVSFVLNYIELDGICRITKNKETFDLTIDYDFNSIRFAEKDRSSLVNFHYCD